MNCIADIDDAIQAAGLTEDEVLRAAGAGARYLYNIRYGYRPLTPKFVNRIKQAIAEVKRQRRMEAREKATNGKRPWESRSAAQYRMAIAFVAHAADVKPAFILEADPARRATADPLWLRAARLRRIALYIANQYLHVEQADLARAASMSKANVSYAMKDVEDDRQSDAEIEAIIRAVEGAFEA
ncbi:hypothetical protein PWG15_05335 [Ensifer adhaerens]|uniref:hypothetical protein n=1 Tax=Ensifer adhaerens TaxID=106592 RepID=UPI0023A961E1|nr:hypothetical protein [Ensifer adhaerens]WDZ77928.1 hypothetical protein PWG15_05335 [Ensifer adhaerens]